MLRKFSYLLITLTGAAISLQSNASTIEELELRIQELEGKLNTQEKKTHKNRKYINSIKNHMDEIQERLRVSGFLSAGFNIASEDGTSTFDKSFGEHYNFATDSKAGIQFDFHVADNVSATMQVISRAKVQDGDKLDWRPEMEWAFLNYSVTDKVDIRAGRFRLPLYLYSDSLDLGFTQPFVRPPLGYYITSISNLDGIDVNYSFNTGEVVHSFQAYAGIWSAERDDSQVYGAVYQLDYKAWQVRASGMGIRIAAGPFIEYPTFYSGSLKYDDGQWLGVFEYSISEADWKLARSLESMYATLGYRIGNFMPYAVYEVFSTQDEKASPIPSVVPKEGTGTSLGVRYNLNANVSVKFQYDDHGDFNGTKGPFNTIGDADADDVSIYSFVVDAVF